MSTTAPPTTTEEVATARFVGRRVGAVVIDLVVVTWLLAAFADIVAGSLVPSTGSGVASLLGWFLGVVLLVVTQGLTGTSVGKELAGLEVVAVARRTGSARSGPPGVRRAVLRHAWLAALPLAALPSLLFFAFGSVLGVVASVLTAVLSLAAYVLPPVLLGTVIADPARRGLHDQWAATEVRPATPPRGRWTFLTVLLLLLAVLAAASVWLGTPDRIDVGRIGSSQATAATCELRHRAWYLETPVTRTVQLERGMAATTVRLGPHEAVFDDQSFAPSAPGLPIDDERPEGFGPDPGLFHELRLRSFGGSTSSGSSGSDGITEVDFDGGATGQLRMRCTSDDAEEPITPEVQVVP